ncbi:MAG: hypothetical protein Q4F84_01440 [Fibrobacter sp.]|nr:hypothetical protein [Fibrobacter sp.]
METNLSREQIIASMAKKLAKKSHSECEKNSKNFITILTVLVLSIVIITATLCGKKNLTNEQTPNHETYSHDTPLMRLKSAYHNKVICVNQYASYLMDMMVRYDSLPEKYKAATPIISDKDVLDELANIWPNVNSSVKMELVKTIPVVNSKIASKNAGIFTNTF